MLDKCIGDPVVKGIHDCSNISVCWFCKKKILSMLWNSRGIHYEVSYGEGLVISRFHLACYKKMVRKEGTERLVKHLNEKWASYHGDKTPEDVCAGIVDSIREQRQNQIRSYNRNKDFGINEVCQRADKKIVVVEEVMKLQEARGKINRIPVLEMEVWENGQKIEISDEIRKEFDFVGLSGMDFITSGFYKEGFTKPDVDPTDSENILEVTKKKRGV